MKLHYIRTADLSYVARVVHANEHTNLLCVDNVTVVFDAGFLGTFLETGYSPDVYVMPPEKQVKLLANFVCEFDHDRVDGVQYKAKK